MERFRIAFVPPTARMPYTVSPDGWVEIWASSESHARRIAEKWFGPEGYWHLLGPDADEATHPLGRVGSASASMLLWDAAERGRQVAA